MARKAKISRRTTKNVVPLTIILLKEGVTDLEALESAPPDTRRVEIDLNDRVKALLATRQSREKPPSWARLFDDVADLDQLRLRNSSASAALLIRTSGRLFALTFGQGRYILNQSLFEERFGLHVVLNCVSADELRSVDVTTLEANPMHGKRQPSQAASLGEFGLNLDQDILRGVTGKPIDETLGTQMTGSDSLTVRVRTDIKDLPTLLTKYLEKSQSRQYEERFSWVDHIAEVRDRELQEQLFTRLVQDIGSDRSRIWAAIPTPLDWSRFDHFRFGTLRSVVTGDDITLDRMLDSIGSEPITIDLLKRRRVYCIERDTSHPVTDWPFLECLTAEVSLDEVKYLLNARTWYKIDKEFAAQVKADIDRIPRASIRLGTWGEETEPTYNERVAKKSDGELHLMDRVMITHKGMASPIEFCDLYSSNKILFHVKRYGQSSVLSHLFSQGAVSAETTLVDAEFRKVLNSRLPDSHKFKDPASRINSSEYEICFAIGSSDPGKLSLPFFSQVTLRNAYKRLHDALGFNVTLTKIKISKLENTDITAPFYKEASAMSAENA
jgi:uncharacterized protein (TIGR04141 family)